MTIRIGCSTGAFFPSVTTNSAIDRAAELGIHDVEVMLQAHGEYQPASFKDLRGRSSAAGVSIRSVHALQRYHPVFDAYQRRVDEGWEMFSRAVEGAASLEAEVLVWHGPCRSDLSLSMQSAIVLEAIDHLAGMCHHHGLKLALENVSWCAMAQTRDVLALASHVPELRHAEATGFAFDPFQAAEADANPFMVLAAMEPRLLDVHLRDHRESEPTNRALVPGDGELPWPALIRAIANTGYDGPLIIEGSLAEDGPAKIARVRALLEPLITSAGEPDSVCDAPLPPGVLEGIQLFNEGEFYECHEAIEHEWHAERGPVRKLYQGILQIGVGFHHIRGGNRRGAILLLTDGIDKVSNFLPSCRGVDTAALVTASTACLHAIENDPDAVASFDWSTVPKIQLYAIADPT